MTSLSLKDQSILCIPFSNYSFKIFTEFRANSSWEDIPVHPRLSLHKSKLEYCNVNEVDLRNTSKLHVVVLISHHVHNVHNVCITQISRI